MPVKEFYLETSVWGCLARKQSRDRKRIVSRLLQLLDGVQGQCVISNAVIEEIESAPTDDASMMNHQIALRKPTVYLVSREAKILSSKYLQMGVLPERRLIDALHVATATCFEIDYLVSWNHRHLTRPAKRRQFEAVNHLHGFMKTPFICNPVEAIHDLRVE